MVDVLPSAPAGGGRATVGRRGLLIGAAAISIGTFLLRFLTVEFTNDHFVHLSRAWQIVQGDVPVRDFFDPGLILQYYASAAALLWSGHNLLGEAILTTGFIAAGAGLTFVAAALLSGSFWIGSTAAVLAVLSMPRLYGYPKVFVYVLAIVGGWWYAHRPGKGTLAVLAAITAVAFLFRHDHGVYIGAAVLALLATRHWGEPRQAIAALAHYGLVTLALLAPFLVFIQSTAGLRPYVAGVFPQAQGLLRIRPDLLPVTIDNSLPWLTVAPPPGPRVNVRWVDALDDSRREDLERRHGLVSREHIEGSTWSYVLIDDDREHVGALIDDPAVADTHGIDRAARELEGELPLYLGLLRQFPVLRARLLPGLFSRGNARAWFYDVTLLAPIVGLFVLAWLLRRGSIDRPEAAVVAMASLLGLVITQTILRGSADSRLPDVASPICVVGAWLGAQSLGRRAGPGAFQRRSRRAGALAVAIVTVWSVATEAGTLATLEASRILSGPSGAWRRMSDTVERLGHSPLDAWDADEPGIPALARYLSACTAPTDRVLVTWFAPQIFFYAERRFAGGQVYLTPGWHSSPRDQQLTIERLERQRVPVVLEQTENEYQAYFRAVHDYVRQHYREASPTSDAIAGLRVLVDQRLTPTGTYERLGLPCYR